MQRRTALSLISGTVFSTALDMSGPAFAAADPSPLLATPAQIDAEKTILSLLADPDLKRLQAKIKADLAGSPWGQTKDAAARLDEAIAQWTNSLLMGEIARYRASPAFLWGTDDTPRTWLGHTLGGVGTSGDNPDAIYDIAVFDGGGRYEINGRIDPAKRLTQLIIEVDHGDTTVPPKLDNSKHSDLFTPISMVTDRDLTIAPDGTFTITLGGPAEGPNHMAAAPGLLTIGVRCILADWSQRPASLTIRRLDAPAAPKPVDRAEILKHALADLEDYVAFWSAFPTVWFGGLKPNTISEPAGRVGGWGFNAGLRYQLGPDDAIVVTMGRGNAPYTGFQIIDPWMIAPDARRCQCCLDTSQSAPNADGSFTYVIAMTDPGVANWLDTAGLHDGFGILRWQATPKDATKDGLIRDFRVVKLAEAAKMPGLARVTPEQRKAQLAARAPSYMSRER